MGRARSYQAYLEAQRAAKRAMRDRFVTLGHPKHVSESTPYARKMDTLSRRIFSDYPRGVDEASLKPGRLMEALPAEQNERWNTRYYLPHPMLHFTFALLRNLGLYRDEHKDFREEMERLKRLRGKGDYWARFGNKK